MGAEEMQKIVALPNDRGNAENWRVGTQQLVNTELFATEQDRPSPVGGFATELARSNSVSGCAIEQARASGQFC